MSEKKLEPCPFCGSSASLTKVENDIDVTDWHLVECDGANEIDCGARSQGFGLKAHAIAAWNRRAARPTGWREGIEAAAKVADDWCRKNHWPNGVWGIAAAIRALVPPGDKEKG